MSQTPGNPASPSRPEPSNGEFSGPDPTAVSDADPAPRRSAGKRAAAPGTGAIPLGDAAPGEETVGRRVRPTGGKRAAEPITGTIPVIDAPLLGDEPGGRRIKAVAPVSAATETSDRLTVRSFDHTGEIPAVQVVVPEDTQRFVPLPVDGAVAAPAPQREPQRAPQPKPEPKPAPKAEPKPVPTVSESDLPEAERRGAFKAITPDAPKPTSTPASKPTPKPETATAPKAVSGSDTSASGTKPSLLERLRVTGPEGASARFKALTGALAIGVLLLALAALHVGPGWFDGVGAVLVMGTYCWAAAARTGGRPVIFSILGVAIGVVALTAGSPVLSSGAAVMMTVVSGVLAVLLTVPARTVLEAVREVAFATAVASIGAFATIGFEPVASTASFEILTLVIGLAAMVALVWRFAAGLHGLGTRGLVIVVVGVVLLGVGQLYSELLRTYGGGGPLPTGDLSAWVRDTFGATPRTTTVLLGIPALLYGVHMRARRRQGWWVCTFGVAAMVPVAGRLVNLETSYVEAGLQTFYSAALGCLVGFVVIRLDQRFTGTRGSRARELEEETAMRPESRRFQSL